MRRSRRSQTNFPGTDGYTVTKEPLSGSALGLCVPLGWSPEDGDD